MILLTSIERPKTAPIGLLAVAATIFLTNLALSANGTFASRVSNICTAVEGLAALCLAIVILRMPLRHPALSTDRISPPYSEPTSDLRSPEDNLTLLQWSRLPFLTLNIHLSWCPTCFRRTDMLKDRVT